MTIATALGLLALAAGLVLLLMRGTFWWPRVPPAIREPARWPSVCAIVPARDEAALIEQSMASLLRQDYAGAFSVVLVDDHSSDGTAEIAAPVGWQRSLSHCASAAFAVRLDWKIIGDEPRCSGSRQRGIDPVHRRRYRAPRRPICARWWRASKVENARSRVADGQAALRKLQLSVF